MEIPHKLKTTRAFIKKAQLFIKYYPIYTKDPGEMLRLTLLELEKLVSKAKTINDLQHLSQDIVDAVIYDHPEKFCQIEVLGEKNRYIIYEPIKFSDSNDSNCIVLVYDLIIIETDQ